MVAERYRCLRLNLRHRKRRGRRSEDGLSSEPQEALASVERRALPRAVPKELARKKFTAESDQSDRRGFDAGSRNGKFGELDFVGVPDFSHDLGVGIGSVLVREVVVKKFDGQHVHTDGSEVVGCTVERGGILHAIHVDHAGLTDSITIVALHGCGRSVRTGTDDTAGKVVPTDLGVVGTVDSPDVHRNRRAIAITEWCGQALGRERGDLVGGQGERHVVGLISTVDDVRLQTDVGWVVVRDVNGAFCTGIDEQRTFFGRGQTVGTEHGRRWWPERPKQRIDALDSLLDKPPRRQSSRSESQVIDKSNNSKGLHSFYGFLLDLTMETKKQAAATEARGGLEWALMGLGHLRSKPKFLTTLPASSGSDSRL